jgi:hypothetical protein
VDRVTGEDPKSKLIEIVSPDKFEKWKWRLCVLLLVLTVLVWAVFFVFVCVERSFVVLGQFLGAVIAAALSVTAELVWVGEAIFKCMGYVSELYCI